jgi:hypothetical protein
MLGLCALGCASDPPGADSTACVTALAVDCVPAYPPSYDAIFDDVLSPRCGSSGSGGSCHYGPTAATAQAGLALSDRAQAYDKLLGRADGRALVSPMDPQCSILVERLESSDPKLRMPFGADPLPENVRCAVRKWIANGALR